MTTLGVVVNEGKQLGSGLEALRAELARMGHSDPPWYEVPKSKKAPKRIRTLVRDHGVDRLLVWGGDGTVRRAIHTVLDDGLGDVEIGILPAGTANLLALNLGIPTDLRRAVEIAVTGEPRPIDVGEINEQHFAVMAGTGFDALLIRDADETGVKDRFGRLGYVWAGVRNTALPPTRATVSIDGAEWFSGDASCVLVGNVSTILGGIEAFPEASPTDGRLDVGVATTRTRTDWLRLLAQATVGHPARSALAEVATAERVTIELARTLPWQVDGGDRERTDTYEVRCRPAAVRICRPPTT